MDMRITNNIKEVERGLSDVARRQIPFATALAINEVLGDIRKNWEKRLRKSLDRPTPFTMKAFAVRRATKRSLTGMVFAKDVQAAYLQWLEDGGTRAPKRRAILVPVGQRLNKYGNMPRGAVARTLASPKVFSGKPKGARRPAGIWRRAQNNTQLELQVVYADRAKYAPRLMLVAGAIKTATARLPDAMLRAMRRAVNSAR
jgi:hypothetical protein